MPLLAHQMHNFRSVLIAEAREAKPEDYEIFYKLVAYIQ